MSARIGDNEGSRGRDEQSCVEGKTIGSAGRGMQRTEGGIVAQREPPIRPGVADALDEEHEAR